LEDRDDLGLGETGLLHGTSWLGKTCQKVLLMGCLRIGEAYDLRRQRLLPVPAWGLARRVDLAAGVVVVRRRGDRQHLADRLDPVGIAGAIDEVLQDLYRRSSSAWAKNADALRRISLAWRSSRTSRSKALIRACSSVVSPGRSPLSRSARRTHVRSVSALQPIFPATD